jgi:hypothetical protein
MPQTLEEQVQHKVRFVEELKVLPVAVQTAAANEQHYEVRPWCGATVAFWGGEGAGARLLLLLGGRGGGEKSYSRASRAAAAPCSSALRPCPRCLPLRKSFLLPPRPCPAWLLRRTLSLAGARALGASDAGQPSPTMDFEVRRPPPPHLTFAPPAAHRVLHRRPGHPPQIQQLPVQQPTRQPGQGGGQHAR